MKRQNFAHTDGVDSVVILREKEVVPLDKVEKDKIVELVFCKDPMTGLPSSDIGVFLNPSTPPQVREFIQSQIFGDGRISAQSSGIDDDTLHELVRDSGETSDAYVSRINRFMLRNKQGVEEAFASIRNANRIKDGLK